MQTRLYVIHALTPLHAGTGQGVGLIDLPIARERSTSHPVLPGSSVKGVMRDACRQANGGDKTAETLTSRIFGPPTTEADKFGGAVRFSDARILLFPVRSDRGTFAWVTCPYALERLRRDAEGLTQLPKTSLPTVVNSQCAVVAKSALVDAKKVVLDGLDFSTSSELVDAIADAIANLVFGTTDKSSQRWREMLKERFCIVSDDSFTWLVEHATEVRARIRIDHETGTVADGALWYEESLPAESVLVGLVQYADNHQATSEEAWETLSEITAGPMQFGGNATVGQGMARVRLHGGGK